MDVGISEIKFAYEVLKDRPELFASVILLFWIYLERSERKNLQRQYSALLDKMQEANKDTNDLLAQIKFLLEILLKGKYS